MGIGLAQAVVWGAAAAILAPVRRAGSAQAATRAAGGLGKLFWTRAFLFPMYGAGVVRTA
jgi:hypothetical protein